MSKMLLTHTSHHNAPDLTGHYQVAVLALLDACLLYSMIAHDPLIQLVSSCLWR